MAHKLNIISRSNNQTGWHQATQFSTPQIQEIPIDGSGKGTALNGIPSPFARMHLFQTAFEMVYQDLVKPSNIAGDVYLKLISDCFDVFELIYNWETHIDDGKKLDIVTWERETEIQLLLKSKTIGHNILGKTLATFLAQDIQLSNFNECLIIKYNGKVIAGSSPFTGFFTTPNSLDNFRLQKPLTTFYYFSQIIPFQDRKPEIRRFIFDFFENNQLIRNDTNFEAIRQYLLYFNEKSDIPDFNDLQLKPILKDGNTELTLFGNTLKTGPKIGVHFFEPFLVRINFTLNDSSFYTPKLKNSKRDYDFLFPLTTAYLNECDLSEIERNVTYTELNKDSVSVAIRHGGKTIEKIYQKRKINESHGQLIDLANDEGLKVNIGIFPFLKVNDHSDKSNFNDFYRVMLVFEDAHNRLKSDDLSLSFWEGKKKFEAENPDRNLQRLNRTHLNVDGNFGSTYFGTNKCFDFIQIHIDHIFDNQKISAAVCPKWRQVSIGTKQFDYAIDFGTTTTFIATTEKGMDTPSPQPFSYSSKDLQVVLLNKPDDDASVKEINKFEETSIREFMNSVFIQKNEFIPSVIKEGNYYKFPTRSVLFVKKGTNPSHFETLLSGNIGFVYQTPALASVDSFLKNVEFKGNLKWNIDQDISYKKSIEIFLEQLMIMIRTRTLINGGDPRKTYITWFSPLSFSTPTKKAYKELWEKIAVKTLAISNKQVNNVTESEAPFYYLHKAGKILNITSVLTLDIGGGSTDIMLFKNEVPVMGSSVNFGANVFWKNAYNEFSAVKSNGIYKSLFDDVKSQISNNPPFTTLNNEYCADGSEYGSDEIINFWIAHNDKTQILELLKSPKYKIGFLIHLSSLIYHNLYLIKMANQPPPSCVLFSGNGSKYVDNIGEDYVALIWEFYGKKIFSSDYKKPQIILPGKDRKEATCYGGVFAPINRPTFNFEQFHGVNSSLKGIKEYGYIDKNKDLVFESVIENVNDFLNIFFEMAENSSLNFRREFGIKDNLPKLKEYFKDKVSPYLNLGYSKIRNKVTESDSVNDSLFFYPFVGLINDYTENGINGNSEIFSNSITLYAKYPENDGFFSGEKLLREKKYDCIYEMKLENPDDKIAKFKFINDSNVSKEVLKFYTTLLDPVCNYSQAPPTNAEIKVISPGELSLNQQGNWEIKKRMEIEFI